MWWSDKKRLGGAASHEVEVIIVALEKKKKKIRKRGVFCLMSDVYCLLSKERERQIIGQIKLGSTAGSIKRK